jgi:hypothetical protein
VRQQGATHFWFAPWDYLIRWYGIQEMMMDLTLRPELVHAAVDRLTRACLKQLDQYEGLELLSLNNGAQIVGSGGLGFTDELPAAGFNSLQVRTADCWGNAAAQIFSDISPRMHEEFALSYERRWLDRFGLTYYGCCDPLHHKVEMLRSIPNLRKISMSPWADVEKGAEQIGRDYVFSYKPNPAILAPEKWNPAEARRALREVLEKTRGCAVEIVLKDISTVHHEPSRLWQWAQIAEEETERCA